MQRVFGIWLATRDRRLTRGGDIAWTVVFLVLLACAAVYPRVEGYLHLTCMFKAWTGIPCAGCGTTRCLVQFVQMHWAAAFLFNPAAFAICVFSIFVILYTAVVRLFKTPRITLAATENGWWVLRGTAAILLASNWVYLIIAGV